MRKSTNGRQLLIVNLSITRFTLELDTAEDPLDSTKTVGDHRALDYDDLLDLVRDDDSELQLSDTTPVRKSVRTMYRESLDHVEPGRGDGLLELPGDVQGLVVIEQRLGRPGLHYWHADHTSEVIGALELDGWSPQLEALEP